MCADACTCLGRFLEGKCAIVTGSTSGIGEGVAEALAKKGCSVVLSGSRPPQEAAALLERIEKTHGVKVSCCLRVCFWHSLAPLQRSQTHNMPHTCSHFRMDQQCTWKSKHTTRTLASRTDTHAGNRLGIAKLISVSHSKQLKLSFSTQCKHSGVSIFW